MPGGGQEMSPALQLPPGSPPPQSGAPPTGAAPASGGPAAAGGTTVGSALQTFANVRLSGRAWLVGEIAVKGSTKDVVEIAVTDRTDEQPLKQAATFPTLFHVVASEPQEQSVEINPSGQPQGA